MLIISLIKNECNGFFISCVYVSDWKEQTGLNLMRRIQALS